MHILNKIITLMIMFCIIIGCNTLNSSEKNKMENKLRERIASVYQAYKERNFDKFLDFRPIEYEKKGNRREILDGMTKDYPPILVDYKIREIKITKDRARVTVTITLLINNKKDVSDSFDYWILKDNEWYLLDFGKIK
jgi:hypothetical protein